VTASQSCSRCCGISSPRFRHGHAYEITTAESAAGAFEILRREPFDLNLLVVVIPATAGRWLSETNLGFGLLTRSRALGVTAPVLVMTGGGSAAKEAEALNAGRLVFCMSQSACANLTMQSRAFSGPPLVEFRQSIVSTVSIRRYSGPTPTSKAGEYRSWLSEQPSADFRRGFHQLAQAKEAKPLRLSLEKNAPAFTFVSSGDLKTDLQVIDLLLKQASR
jgi:CheY-like chemotaxis protein